FDALTLVGNLSKTIVLPALLGLLVRNRLPRITESSKPYVDLVSKLGMISVLVVNGVALKPIVGRLGWGMAGLILIVAIHVLANFATGLAVSSLILGRRNPSVTAVMYSSSMRNNAAGLVIATNYFSPAVSLPVIGCMIVQHFWAGVFLRIVGGRREGVPPLYPERGAGSTRENGAENVMRRSEMWKFLQREYISGRRSSKSVLN
ncbi:MAG: bile acid:sodium symporter family protein, partial [Spirochaetota bacterium]